MQPHTAHTAQRGDDLFHLAGPQLLPPAPARAPGAAPRQMATVNHESKHFPRERHVKWKTFGSFQSEAVWATEETRREELKVFNAGLNAASLPELLSRAIGAGISDEDLQTDQSTKGLSLEQLGRDQLASLLQLAHKREMYIAQRGGKDHGAGGGEVHDTIGQMEWTDHITGGLFDDSIGQMDMDTNLRSICGFRNVTDYSNHEQTLGLNDYSYPTMSISGSYIGNVELDGGCIGAVDFLRDSEVGQLDFEDSAMAADQIGHIAHVIGTVPLTDCVDSVPAGLAYSTVPRSVFISGSNTYDAERRCWTSEGRWTSEVDKPTEVASTAGQSAYSSGMGSSGIGTTVVGAADCGLKRSAIGRLDFRVSEVGCEPMDGDRIAGSLGAWLAADSLPTVTHLDLVAAQGCVQHAFSAVVFFLCRVSVSLKELCVQQSRGDWAFGCGIGGG